MEETLNHAELQLVLAATYTAKAEAELRAHDDRQEPFERALNMGVVAAYQSACKKLETHLSGTKMAP